MKIGPRHLYIAQTHLLKSIGFREDQRIHNTESFPIMTDIFLSVKIGDGKEKRSESRNQHQYQQYFYSAPVRYVLSTIYIHLATHISVFRVQPFLCVNRLHSRCWRVVQAHDTGVNKVGRKSFLCQTYTRLMIPLAVFAWHGRTFNHGRMVFLVCFLT